MFKPTTPEKPTVAKNYFDAVRVLTGTFDALRD
jgi:hypothetical protein